MNDHINKQFSEDVDWEIIFQSIEHPTVILSTDHTIKKINHAALRVAQKPAEEILGKKCFEVFHGTNRYSNSCPMQEILQKGLRHTHRAVIEALGGYYMVNCSPVFDPDDKLLYIIHIATDITSYKESEEKKNALEIKLQQVQKMAAISTLAGGIAHDFNNLLMGIQGCAALMRMHTEQDSPSMEKLLAIEQQVQSGSELTGQLLVFAQGGDKQVRPVDLNKLVENSANMFGHAKREISLKVKCQADLWCVEVDKSQIEQVLLNLFMNAWHAMPCGGFLYIETQNTVVDDKKARHSGALPGKYVVINVTDTGVGMDMSTQERIFEPFYTTKERGRGVGMGLTASYGIVKSHDGFIDLWSKKNQGTCFKIYLPVAKKIAKKTIDIETGEVMIGNETILVVDDEPIVLQVTSEILTTLGYNVLTARTGQEAVSLFEKHKKQVRLVLLDLIMPGQGCELTYHMLKECQPQIKVLLSSGYSVDSEISNMLEKGCASFIQKPYSIAGLSCKIREIIDSDLPTG